MRTLPRICRAPLPQVVEGTTSPRPHSMMTSAEDPAWPHCPKWRKEPHAQGLPRGLICCCTLVASCRYNHICARPQDCKLESHTPHAIYARLARPYVALGVDALLQQSATAAMPKPAFVAHLARRIVSVPPWFDLAPAVQVNVNKRIRSVHIWPQWMHHIFV